MKNYSRQLAFLLLLTSSSKTLSQDSSDVPNIAVGVLRAFMTRKLSPEIPDNQIRGKCFFQNTICPGATIALKELNDKLVQELTIDSTGEFVFTRLPKKKYKLELTYKKYGLSKTLEKVTTGAEILIELRTAE